MEESFKNAPSEPFEDFASQPASPQKSAEADNLVGSDSPGSGIHSQSEQSDAHPSETVATGDLASTVNLPLAEETDGDSSIIIQCNNLTKNYGSIPALSDVTFNVKSGGVVGLLGPNGSGKSTFIKLAMGMLQPTSGEILIDGKKPSPETKAITAYLPDANYLCDWMTVDRQVKYCADFFADFNLLKAEGLLSRLGISGKQKIKTLSKGNKEKLGLILTMARDARLYILDEPIAGVDPAARDFILDTVMTNRPQGATIFLCTHLISDVEPILTHALFLNRGAIVLNKGVEEVRQQEGKSLDELFREVFRW
ncbi:MAG: ABC transporter ATP-binding protein [Candidatus Coproplasma sp.]